MVIGHDRGPAALVLAIRNMGIRRLPVAQGRMIDARMCVH
jgi:hypothetical protein